MMELVFCTDFNSVLHKTGPLWSVPFSRELSPPLSLLASLEKLNGTKTELGRKEGHGTERSWAALIPRAVSEVDAQLRMPLPRCLCRAPHD